jgi:hypothetical protein
VPVRDHIERTVGKVWGDSEHSLGEVMPVTRWPRAATMKARKTGYTSADVEHGRWVQKVGARSLPLPKPRTRSYQVATTFLGSWL